jgi:hypothetical protein
MDLTLMSETNQKSNQIFHHNVNWLLCSDIRIKDGQNKGALFGWKNMNPKSFPFIYSEITGYAITSFSWIYSSLRNNLALQAARESADWILRNMQSNLLVARPPASGIEPNELSEVFYSFDNGMIIIGLVNLYKLTKNVENLVLAEKMSQTLIGRFFDGEKLTARLDKSFNQMTTENINGLVKWSTISGGYHAKLSLAFLELSRLTKDPTYSQVSNSICDYAIKMQGSGGRFVTNPGSGTVYLHPHLYTCEGLIYSGIMQSNKEHYSVGLKGVLWAIEQAESSKAGGLCANTESNAVEQSDCTAQLVRLLILCRSQLENIINSTKLDNVIQRLHSRLLDFYISDGDGMGGIRYQLGLDSACSWCTMFSMQAFHLWKIRNSKLLWLDYFV